MCNKEQGFYQSARGGEPEVYGWGWTEELKGVEVNDGISFGPNKPKLFSHMGTTFQYAPLYTQHVVAPLLAEIERLKEGSDKTLKAIREQWKASDQKWMRERDTLKARCEELEALLRKHSNHVATLCDVLFRYGAGMESEPSKTIYAALAHQQIVNAALNQPAPAAKCKTCNGSGIEYDGAGHTCTACNGSGQVKVL